MLDLAEMNNFLVIEDDYDSETNYQSNPYAGAEKPGPPRPGYLRRQPVEKPCHRVCAWGYMVAHPTLIREARAIRRLMLRHPPTNNQRSLALFLERGYHDVLLRQIHRTFKLRWQRMSDALQTHLPEFVTPSNIGGTGFLAKSARRPGFP
ncbi:MAG: hypothetical protein MH219_18185 [Marinobacter sp.]|nr:hypothetical protein [Marinobacter sp.]